MKLTLNSLKTLNKESVSSVRGGKVDNIIARVLKYVVANHKDLLVTPEKLQEYIKLANFQNYFKVDGVPLVQRFSNLEDDDNGLMQYIVKNQDKITGSTTATKSVDLQKAIKVWLDRAKPYVNSHFLNDSDTGQMSLNFDGVDKGKPNRFAYRCKELEDGTIQFFEAPKQKAS